MIRITSKRDGFRRCGVEHSSRPTTYPDDAWTPEQLARLKAEPMLIVEEIPEPSASAESEELPEPSPEAPKARAKRKGE